MGSLDACSEHDHPLARAESRERLLRAQFAVTVAFGVVAALLAPFARRARAAARRSAPTVVAGALRAGAPSLAHLRLRERAFELIASGREELPLRGGRERARASPRPPLPPPARAHARRDHRCSRARATGGRRSTPTTRPCTPPAPSCARSPACCASCPTRAGPRRRARHAPDPRRRHLAALPGPGAAPARGARAHPARARPACLSMTCINRGQARIMRA